MELQKKQDNQLQRIFKQPLVEALQCGNRQDINKALELYKDGSGYNFLKLLSVPVRLPAMAEINYNETLAILVVAISKSLSVMNLNRPMNGEQIIELAETIIDSAKEDYLALEDLVMFLQGLTRGKYGPLYESMDIPKFMEKFEIYRHERHLALMAYREEQHAQHKAFPVNERLADMFPDSEKNNMHEAMKEYLKRNNGEKYI